jgi:hypothetical protein
MTTASPCAASSSCSIVARWPEESPCLLPNKRRVSCGALGHEVNGGLLASNQAPAAELPTIDHGLEGSMSVRATGACRAH